MRTKTVFWAALPLLALAVVSSSKAVMAKPIFAENEGKPCKYCHVPGTSKRAYRGLFYKQNNFSFAGFDDAAEAKKAGVEIGPEPEPKPKSWTPPAAPAVPVAPVPPPVVYKPVYPGPGEVVFGDTAEGVVKDGKPVGKGWTSLFDGKSLKGWVGEKGYWSVVDGAIVGDKKGETPHHHYLFSDKDYGDFELHIDVKMTGYNSGVCARINPKSFDDVPGYQVDMGDGYWGVLWDEHHRQKKIFDFPKADADKIVRAGDWNHYYVRMVGDKITIFLNGVKTADGVDPDGFKSGPLGFQLCHGANTVAAFKNIYVKPIGPVLKSTAPKPAANPVP